MEPKITLDELAEAAMLERGFIPSFPEEALEESAAIYHPAKPTAMHKDMTDLLWVSIDNIDSQDLDQLTYAKGNIIYVAIADVDALIPKDSAIDKRAAHNTTSVYTPTRVFPLFPIKFCFDLTSLNEGQRRCAIVVEMHLAEDGKITDSHVYPAVVENKAKLNYEAIGDLLKTGQGERPELHEQLFLQHKWAQIMKKYREAHGALEFGVVQLRAMVKDSKAVAIVPVEHNFAHQLIENFMIFANITIAHLLKTHEMPAIQRVVKTPRKWDRIAAIARENGFTLPPTPEPKPLRAFLLKEKEEHPETFPDLSLTIIKLLGRGEYVFHRPHTPLVGHFDLAEHEYTHATAPNRRYPDVIMQRIVKSILFKTPLPYTMHELGHLAEQCTLKEDDASRVERQLLKSAAAFVLQDQIGNTFTALVTGANTKGTWIRVKYPPIEGKLIRGQENLEEGQIIKVKLIKASITTGHIDFTRV